MANIHAGYRGLITGIGSGNVRFTDCSLSAKQAVEVPDVVMGDFNHDVFAYGKAEVNGTISGLVDEDFATSIWTWAWQRDSCGLLQNKYSPVIHYFCDGTSGTQQTITDAYANSLNFSCAAGDIANWSVEVIASKKTTFTSSAAPSYSDTKKLITWDKIGITASGGDRTPTTVAFQNVDFTVANNCEAVYAIGSGMDLFPYDVVTGIRSITGSLTVFDVDTGLTGADAWGDYTTSGQCTLTFDIGGLVSQAFKVNFHRIEPSLGTGLITSTVAFTGVGVQP